MTVSGKSDEWLVEAISIAIHDHEFSAVEMLLRLLTAQNPQMAQDVLDTIHLGADLSRLAQPDSK